jgi:hypothetical protein
MAETELARGVMDDVVEPAADEMHLPRVLLPRDREDCERTTPT